MIVLKYNETTSVPLNVNQYKTLSGNTYYTMRLVSNKQDDIVFSCDEITGTTRSSYFNFDNTSGGTNITSNQEYLLYVYQTSYTGNTDLTLCSPLKAGTTFNKNKDFLIIQKVFISEYIKPLITKTYDEKLKIRVYGG